MVEPSTDPALQTKIKQIIDQGTYPDSGLSSEEQEKFINRYSLGALTLNVVYFFAMSDSPMAWLSLACSVIFIFAPLLFIFPFFARRRAYTRRQWSSFNHFYAVQRQWDLPFNYQHFIYWSCLLVYRTNYFKFS